MFIRLFSLRLLFKYKLMLHSYYLYILLEFIITFKYLFKNGEKTYLMFAASFYSNNFLSLADNQISII